ncbi:hypothetical protein [Streptomyces sp. NPDC049970]
MENSPPPDRASDPRAARDRATTPDHTPTGSWPTRLISTVNRLQGA